MGVHFGAFSGTRALFKTRAGILHGGQSEIHSLCLLQLAAGWSCQSCSVFDSCSSALQYATIKRRRVVRTIATGLMPCPMSTGNNSRSFESTESNLFFCPAGAAGVAGVGSLAAGNGRLGQWLWSITWAIGLAVGGRSVRCGSGLTFLSFLYAVEEGARAAPPVYARGAMSALLNEAGSSGSS